jgi:putative membrane protein
LKGLAFILIIIILLFAAIIIGSQNDAVVSVNYLLAKTEITVASLIAIAMGLGVVIGCLIMMTTWLALRLQVLRLRSKVKKLSKEP